MLGSSSRKLNSPHAAGGERTRRIVMRTACYRNPLGVCLLVATAAFTCGATCPANTNDPTEKDLVGSWELKGKVNVFSADGTGTSYDGSRCRWKLEDGRLVARRLGTDGSLDEEWSVPIVFTKDRNEFSYLLGADDGGRQRVTFHKLDPDGRPYQGRTDADRAYPPDAEALRGEGPPEKGAPTPVRPAPDKVRGCEANDL
jgi:hypothetical protein